MSKCSHVVPISKLVPCAQCVNELEAENKALREAAQAVVEVSMDGAKWKGTYFIDQEKQRLAIEAIAALLEKNNA